MATQFPDWNVPGGSAIIDSVVAPLELNAGVLSVDNATISSVGVVQLNDTYGSPVSHTDATTSFYVSAAVAAAVSSSLRPVNSVVAFVNTNTALTGITTVLNSAGTTITLVNGNNVCLSNQTTSLQNARYVFNSGNLTLASDCGTGTNQQNTIFSETTTGNQYVLVSSTPVVVGTNVLNYTLFSAGKSYFADGVTLSLDTMTNTFSILNLGVGTAQIADSAVTYAKIQNVAANSVLGNSTGSSAVVSALALSIPSTASSIIQRDSNQNAFANSFTNKATNVSSAGATTTLTAASARWQNLTGTSAQTFQLPDATTLSIGARFDFNNNSTGLLTVKDGAGSTIFTVPSGGQGYALLLVNVITAGSWDYHFILPSNVQWGTSLLAMSANITTTGSVSIGSSSLTSSAILALSSTSQGFLPPSMTTTQKNAISSPAAGLTVYDNTLLDIQFWNGSAWIGTTSSGVTSVSGTSNRISTSSTTGAVIVDIAATYVGQASITTLGTIGTGVWQGTAIGPTFGGTGQTTYALGDMLYASATNTLSKLAGNTTTKMFLTQTGTGVVSAAPAWGTIATSDLPTAALSATGDTNIGIALGGSPTTALINATSITLSWNGLLSAARGGTGVNNGSNTITLGGNISTAGSLTTSGAFASTFTMTGITTVTFPTSGTLATVSGTVPTVQGTTNQILINGGTSAVGGTNALFTLSSTLVTPGTLAINGMTQGSVLFAGSGSVVSQDNANFFWDATNHRLGIGTTGPSYLVTMTGSFAPGNPGVQLTNTTSTTGIGHLFQSLYPNLAVSQFIVGYEIGTNTTNYNTAYLGFYKVGTGSTSNFATIGLFGKDHILVATGNGNVGINDTSPGAGLSVGAKNAVIGFAGGTTFSSSTGLAVAGQFCVGSSTIGSAQVEFYGNNSTTQYLVYISGASHVGNATGCTVFNNDLLLAPTNAAVTTSQSQYIYSQPRPGTGVTLINYGLFIGVGSTGGAGTVSKGVNLHIEQPAFGTVAYALEVAGGLILATRTTTGSSTATTADYYIFVNGSAPNTQTLPAAVPSAGWTCFIKDVAGNAATNNITISGTGLSLVLMANGACVQIVSNGTNYYAC